MELIADNQGPTLRALPSFYKRYQDRGGWSSLLIVHTLIKPRQLQREAS